jgi:hypothetical protein
MHAAITIHLTNIDAGPDFNNILASAVGIRFALKLRFVLKNNVVEKGNFVIKQLRT